MQCASSRSTERLAALVVLVVLAVLAPTLAWAQAEDAAPVVTDAATIEPATIEPAVGDTGVVASSDASDAASDTATSDASDTIDPALQWLLDALRVVRPTLLGEIDYRVYAREPAGETGFALGRFRIGLVLEPLPWLRAVGTVEWVGEYPILLDAYVTAHPEPWIEVFVGYAKPPLFASFRSDAVHVMAFTDRAPVVRAFFVRRDVGVDVRLRPREVPIEAVARIGNGSGSILGNDNALPAGYGALDLVLGRAWSGAHAGDREHGLRVGVAGLVESVRDRDGVMGTEAFGYVFHRAAIVSGLRLVGEAHAIGYVGPLRLTVEAAVAHEERSRDDDGNPSTPRRALPSMISSGLTAELAWVVLGGARVPGAAPTLASDATGWGGGALEIAARFDGLWLGRGAPDVAAGGALGGGLSVKWWPLDFLAATLVGHALRYEVSPIESPGELWGWDAALRLSLFWGQAPSVPAR